jgi:hypothetical protein
MTSPTVLLFDCDDYKEKPRCEPGLLLIDALLGTADPLLGKQALLTPEMMSMFREERVKSVV